MSKLTKSILTLLLVSILLASSAANAFASQEHDPIGRNCVQVPYASMVQK